MKQFDFYEFTGILLPGTIVLTTLVLLFPGWGLPALIKDISVGGLGVFVVLAYSVGHIVQAIGNLVEAVWWRAWGGLPSDWLRTRPSRLLAAQQISALEKRIRERQGLDGFDITSAAATDWYAITRQIYADVASAGRSARIDTFNGNYGLNRGIAAGLLVVLALLPVPAPADLRVAICILIAEGLALYRMHRFARHYARELFIQFLQLPEREKQKENKS